MLVPESSLMPVLFFIVPVAVLGTEIVIHVLIVVVHVFAVNHRLAVSATELIAGAISQFLPRICMPDHESCVCMIFFNSLPFTWYRMIYTIIRAKKSNIIENLRSFCSLVYILDDQQIKAFHREATYFSLRLNAWSLRHGTSNKLYYASSIERTKRAGIKHLAFSSIVCVFMMKSR